MTKFRSNQAIGAKDFSIPAGYTEAKLPLPIVWDHHLAHNDDYPFFHYDTDAGNVEIITWGNSVRAIHRTAKVVKAAADELGIEITDVKKPPVIAVLAMQDTPTIWATINGIQRAGFTVFLVSVRNSPVAVAHLLKATNARALFVSGVPMLRNLAQAAVGETGLKILDMPKFDAIFKKEDPDFTPLPPFSADSLLAPAIILHSSGSTSFPKAITLTHEIVAQWSLMPYYGELQFYGKLLGVHCLPLFHIMGVAATIMWPAASGAKIAVFDPTKPPSIPTPDKTLAGAINSKSHYVLGPPAFVEIWASNPEILKSLKQFECIFFAGGPLKKDIGNTLVKEGIKIKSFYGATETGGITSFTERFPGDDWEYIEFSAQYKMHFRPQGDHAGSYELVIQGTPMLTLCLYNTEVDGEPAYATNDLLIRHPTKPTMWKVHGRADDQIIHSNGEKTNPGPLETIISYHPSVQTCLMFGSGQFQTGVIVVPVEGKRFDPKDQEKLTAFRNEIWSSVEQANEFAPKHSRVFKEMLIVTYPDRPIQLTAKGTLRRKAMLEEYADDITEVYRAVDESSLKDVTPPITWSVEETTDYIHKVVEKVLEKPIGKDDDLFQYGVDSLQATSIRNSVLRALRDAQKDATHLSQNSIYANPTISALGQLVSQIANEGSATVPTPVVAAKTMQDIVAEYTKEFPTHKGSKPLPANQVVLITGTTGALGSYILEALISNSAIGKVYALNRPDSQQSSNTAVQRQSKAFQERGINPSVLKSSKLTLLEGDLNAKDLGLSSSQYKELSDSVTTIIANAWRVDFNLSLASFKPLFSGLKNLINFALGSSLSQPPRIVFSSSISSLTGWRENKPVPEKAFDDPAVAIGSGYGESKWVAERILDIAGQKTPLTTIVVRVGQLCGSTTDGSWSIWEWFPALVQSFKLTGSQPDVPGVVSWVPINVAAKAIIDLANSPSPVVHLVHPNPVPWSVVIKPIADTLGVSTVPYTEWLKKLEESSTTTSVEAAREHPALRVIDFYRFMTPSEASDAEAFTKARLDTTVAVKTSSTLAKELRALDAALVKKWVDYWKQKGVLN